MRVLHLEDSAVDTELVAMKLTRAWPHCRVHSVATRAQYQTAIERGEFDLIVSDYTLSDYDGLSALEFARGHCPEKPFIFFSGTIGEERAIGALRCGATDYVLKDRPTRLVPAIRQAMARNEEAQAHRRTDEALRQNRERLGKIAEHVDDLIVMFDLDGRVLYCNPAYQTAVGRAPEEGIENVFDGIHPADRERVREVLREMVQAAGSARMEFRLQLTDHAVRFVEAQSSVFRESSGAVAQIMVVARDVTERRAAEQRIAEQAALLDKIQDAIMVRDLTDRVTYWNQGAARLYAHNAEAARGRVASDLWTEDGARVETARQAALIHGEWLGELHHRLCSGAEIVVQSHWSLMKEPGGSPTGFLVINTDITEKKRLESQFLRSQRTESIGLLAGCVAHDINNVLAPIVLSIDLLRPLAASLEARNVLASIGDRARHGTALVQQLLAFARGTPGQDVRISLRPMLGEFVEFLAQTMPRTLKLTLRVTEEPWPVSGDATQLKQVLMNLCLNAQDAMPDGGQVVINLVNIILGEAEARALRDLKAGPHVMISVADTGTGMPPEVLDRIFDPFFTTKGVGKGTGLGLAAVRGIMKGHRGALAVESTPGRGTTFRLYLPALTDNLAQPVRATQSSSKHGAGERILLIDDEPVVRDLIGAVLTAYGYNVHKASSGADGLKFFESHETEISLALTDITMEGMNGLQVIRALRKRRFQLPILAMSGLTGAGVYESDLRALGVPLLAKPLTREALLVAVQAALKVPPV